MTGEGRARSAPRSRRAIVPRKHLDAVAKKAARERLKTVVGDPAIEGCAGALASPRRNATERVAELARGNRVVFGRSRRFAPGDEGVAERLLRTHAAAVRKAAVEHQRARRRSLRAPWSTLMPTMTSTGRLPSPPRQQGAWSARWSRATKVAARRHSYARARGWPPAGAGPRGGVRIDPGHRLALRCWSLGRAGGGGGTGRRARGEALPAAPRCRPAFDADRRHRRIRAASAKVTGSSARFASA